MDTLRPNFRGEFEFAIICALPLEFDAICLLLDERWDEDGDAYKRAIGDSNTYTTGRIGKYPVVLALLPDMGKVNAASTSASLRSSYTGLRLAFLVGICGGVPNSPEGDIYLGDVIISRTIVQYDYGKQYPQAFIRKNTTSDNSSREVRNLLKTLETDTLRDWLTNKAVYFLKELQANAKTNKRTRKYKYPGRAQDQLYSPTYDHKHHRNSDQICYNCPEGLACDEASEATCEELRCSRRYLVNRTRSREDQSFSFHMGAIASGDQVMKSGVHRDMIAQKENVIAFEMEGAGVWEEVPCIVVKGVCDYADSHKSKKWQNFAAATAASTTKAILLRYTQTDRLSPTPEPRQDGARQSRTSINSFGERAVDDFFYRPDHPGISSVDRHGNPNWIHRKLVIVGDGAVGKTSLLHVFKSGRFPELYVPTVYENQVSNLVVDGKPLELELWDTAGQEEYDRLRPLSYPETDIVIIAFSIGSRTSYRNVRHMWEPEIRHFLREVPILLIGTKKDLRYAEEHKRRGHRRRVVSIEEAETLAREIRAYMYLECSAKGNEGVKEVFKVAARVAMQGNRRNQKRSGCIIL